MEQPIKLNQILNLSQKEICNCKLHLAAASDDAEPLDVFSRDFEEWKGWNEWRANKNDFTRDFIFSLIPDYHRPGKYLFGGLFRITKRFNDYAKTKRGYEVELCDRFSNLVGRLVVNFYRYQGMRGRAFYLESYLDSMDVAEILETPYGGIDFPGYDSVRLPFSMLELLVKNQKQDWRIALENVKGIYVIVDKSNGKKYVGSAYGAYGIWHRWSCYASTGHGYNDELVELINHKGIEYARTNFQISILELLTMKTDDDTVIRRESFWKDVLQTRGQFGYNKN